MEFRGRLTRRAFVPTAILAALLTGVSAMPANAAAAPAGWHSYLEQPKRQRRKTRVSNCPFGERVQCPGTYVTRRRRNHTDRDIEQ